MTRLEQDLSLLGPAVWHAGALRAGIAALAVSQTSAGQADLLPLGVEAHGDPFKHQPLLRLAAAAAQQP